MSLMNPRSDIESLSSIELAAQLNVDIVKEGIRQAKYSFTLANRTFHLSAFMSAASGIIGLAGVALLLSGQINEGTTTTAGGITSSVVFAQLSKEAREQLEKSNARLDAIRDELWDSELSSLFYPILKKI